MSAGPTAAASQRQAVVDLGSNSFRLVVFSWVPGEWWKRTDEIYEAVRIGEGLEQTGALQVKPMERALQTLEVYTHYCDSTHIDDVRAVATSAIRDATNQAEFLQAARERSGFEVEVLSVHEEARYGYLAAVNTTSLADGVALDLGGGSMQLTRALNDELLGHHGNDVIRGAGGRDVLWGDWDPRNHPSRQRDRLDGGSGNDWLYSSHGRNTIRGGRGNDYVWAYYGKGTIDCGPGRRDTARVRLNGPYRVRNCERIRNFCAFGSKPGGGCYKPGERPSKRTARRS